MITGEDIERLYAEAVAEMEGSEVSRVRVETQEEYQRLYADMLRRVNSGEMSEAEFLEVRQVIRPMVWE